MRKSSDGCRVTNDMTLAAQEPRGLLLEVEQSRKEQGGTGTLSSAEYYSAQCCSYVSRDQRVRSMSKAMSNSLLPSISEPETTPVGKAFLLRSTFSE